MIWGAFALLDQKSSRMTFEVQGIRGYIRALELQIVKRRKFLKIS